jgi:hypothetical protein
MSGLWHSFQEGGWAMYLIFAFGLTAVGAAGRFAWRGEHQLMAFIRWLMWTVVGSGCFGFFIGMQAVLGAIVYRFAEMPLERRAMIFLEGSKEALTCISGSLMFVVVICLLLAVGLRRFPLPNPGSVVR